MRPKPVPKMSQEYYAITCTHCQKTVFVNALDLRGVFGRLMRCPLCIQNIRIYKRTQAFQDKCKICEKLVICIGTPTIRVGTGTAVKKKQYALDELKGHIMITIQITGSVC